MANAQSTTIEPTITSPITSPITSAIGDKERRAYRFGISERSSPLVVPPYGNDYDIDVARTDGDLRLTERTGNSYRSSFAASTPATDIYDDLYLPRKNHFRELTVNLTDFHSIIDRIQDSSETSMKNIKYAERYDNDGSNLVVLPVKSDESNEFNSSYGCLDTELVKGIDTVEQSELSQKRRRRREQRQRKQLEQQDSNHNHHPHHHRCHHHHYQGRLEQRRQRRRHDSLSHWPNDTESAGQLSIGRSSSPSSLSSSSSSLSLSSSSSPSPSSSSSPTASKFQFHSSIPDQPCLKSIYIPSRAIGDNDEYTGHSFTKPTNEDEKNSRIAHSDEWKNIVDLDYKKVAFRSNNTTSLPSIIINHPDENPFSQILTRDHFSPTCRSIASADIRDTISTLEPTVWPEYSNRLENSSRNGTISKVSSCCSSRAHSPGSGKNSESPLGFATTSGPHDSSQISPVYRIPASLPSPTSSNRSYGDTPSPLNYIFPLSDQVEEQVCDNVIDEMPMWVDVYERRTTLVPSEMCDVAMDTIDNNELQLVEEVIRDFGIKCDSVTGKSGCVNGDEAAQVVPHYDCCGNKSEEGVKAECAYATSSPINVPLVVDSCEAQEKSDSRSVTMDFTYSSYPGSSACGCYEYSRVDEGRANSFSSVACEGKGQNMSTNEYSISVSSTYAENRIPETVSIIANGQSNGHPDNRKSDRPNIAPWPSLNLPSIKASERLKEGLNAKDVERAMSNLLKRPIEELASADQDGDTMLMCLVGNPEELRRKKAYLVPLVERLSNLRGSLSRTNNRGEDALYLAATTCPGMPYVTGYLAAAMLQKGIDIGQKLYHTRGDTLIHSVAARGDTHGEVLAELLALKSSQGHSVFDLSKRNYDGRTALHVAVESHDPLVRGVSAVATVQLLLENGADARIKETKCGDTALHMAISLSCDPALVKVLLGDNAYATEVVNAFNYNYNTPLHMAAAMSTMVTNASSSSRASLILERQKEVCTMLVQAGGQINIQNRQGKTPLALVPFERKEIVRRIFHRRA